MGNGIPVRVSYIFTHPRKTRDDGARIAIDLNVVFFRQFKHLNLILLRWLHARIDILFNVRLNQGTISRIEI